MGAGDKVLQNDAVNEAAKPRFHRGKPGGIGVLMIHGLTASPTEVAPLFEYLESHHPEWSLSSPLLPGHGTTVQDLRRVGCDQWIETVEVVEDFLERINLMNLFYSI